MEGCPFCNTCIVNSSSSEAASMLYKPGKSNMAIDFSPVETFPKDGSMVMPGKFPTFFLIPVSTLNNVVLPQFGVPTNAM